jgi:hypothetical protein
VPGRLNYSCTPEVKWVLGGLIPFIEMAEKLCYPFMEMVG